VYNTLFAKIGALPCRFTLMEMAYGGLARFAASAAERVESIEGEPGKHIEQTSISSRA